MIIMKEMQNIPGTNMLFNVTYCSYSEGNKCTINSLVFHIEKVYTFINELYINPNIDRNIDIPAIQNVLLSGNFFYSPLCLVRQSNGEFSELNKPIYTISPSTLEDLLVIYNIMLLLVNEFEKSSYFSASSYGSYAILYHLAVILNPLKS